MRENRKVLISGAGVAGACLAFWLLRYGFEPVLIERAPQLRSGGYMIDIWGLAFDIAEKMGLLAALQRKGYRIEELRFEEAYRRRTGGLNIRVFQQVPHNRFLSILRGDLTRLLYEALEGKVRTMFDDSAVEIEQDGEGVRVTFARTPPERFDLVIGAGGLHSAVRTLVFGPEDHYERYLGYYAASFSVADYPHKDPGAYVSYAAPGRQVSRCSLRDDRTVFLLVFASDRKPHLEHRNLAAQIDLLRRAFGEDRWECPAMLSSLDRCSDLYFDPVSQIRMDAWSHGRVALVGDACFCPSLLAGQGSALAMLGAYIVAGELKKAAGDAQVAFRAYERVLHPFIENKQRAGERFSRSVVPKTDCGIYTRNLVTNFMSGPFVARLALGRLLSDSLRLPSYDSS